MEQNKEIFPIPLRTTRSENIPLNLTDIIPSSSTLSIPIVYPPPRKPPRVEKNESVASEKPLPLCEPSSSSYLCILYDIYNIYNMYV